MSTFRSTSAPPTALGSGQAATAARLAAAASGVTSSARGRPSSGSARPVASSCSARMMKAEEPLMAANHEVRDAAVSNAAPAATNDFSK